MSAPQISVIIPVYNAQKTIARTLESALGQTFCDIEIIVINDGSTDKSLQIIREYSDRRIKVFCFDRAGVALSRNRGIARSLGRFLAFLDADDLWSPKKLEHQFAVLSINPLMKVAYSWVNYIDEQDNFLWHGCHQSVTGDVRAHLLLTNFLETASNPLIEKQALLDVGYFQSNLASSHDRDLYIRLAAKYYFMVVPIVAIYYRVSPRSMSADIQNLKAGGLKVIHQSFREAPYHYQGLKRVSLSNFYKILINKACVFPLKISHLFFILFALFELAKLEHNLITQEKYYKFLLKTLILFIPFFRQKYSLNPFELVNTIERDPFWVKNFPVF